MPECTWYTWFTVKDVVLKWIVLLAACFFFQSTHILPSVFMRIVLLVYDAADFHNPLHGAGRYFQAPFNKSAIVLDIDIDCVYCVRQGTNRNIQT